MNYLTIYFWIKLVLTSWRVALALVVLVIGIGFISKAKSVPALLLLIVGIGAVIWGLLLTIDQEMDRPG